MIFLSLKEPPPLLDGSFHYRVFVVDERYFGAIGLEEILVDVEAGAKGFEGRFEPFHRIFLGCAVKAFVVYAGHTKNHAHVSTLG